MWYTEDTFQSQRTRATAIKQYMQTLRATCEEEHGPFVQNGVIKLKGLTVSPAWEEILAKAPQYFRSVHAALSDKKWKSGQSASSSTFGAYVMAEFRKCLDSPKLFLKLVADIAKGHIHALHVPAETKTVKEPGTWLTVRALSLSTPASKWIVNGCKWPVLRPVLRASPLINTLLGVVFFLQGAKMIIKWSKMCQGWAWFAIGPRSVMVSNGQCLLYVLGQLFCWEATVANHCVGDYTQVSLSHVFGVPKVWGEIGRTPDEIRLHICMTICRRNPYIYTYIWYK